MSKKLLKRLKIYELMDLKIDYAFKQLFGSERNKEITVVFLNAILHRTGRDAIKEIMFINQEYGGQYEDDKQSRLDIVVRTQTGNLINVEMQISNQNDMMKRTLYYWSLLFTSQLQRKQGYHRLLPTITINICDFTMFDTSHYHSTYHLYEDTTKERLSPKDDVLEIHFIEMRKFIRLWCENGLDPFDDILVRWLLLLGVVDVRNKKVYDEIYEELEALAMTDDRLLNAFDAWEELSQNPESIIAYQSRLKTMIDEEAKLDYAEFKGMEQGLEQGLEQGKKNKEKEFVLASVKNGLDILTISQITNLSEEHVERIIKEAKS